MALVSEALLNRGTADSSCRLAPSLAGSLWGFSLVGKETLFMGSRDGLLAVPGALQKDPNIINLAQCALLPVNSLIPAGKAE